ncbi:hypothetical protein XELAEV_18031653mg [Xenopus laevis]|uniref:Uncharacterized protein n=1 Tax=Xenopus laevis TaxID=8355 RepID=A0A974CP66_XENLA|nr:hypothetical protein XELAEV_18031653mg [Xenopus laevis]
MMKDVLKWTLYSLPVNTVHTGSLNVGNKFRTYPVSAMRFLSTRNAASLSMFVTIQISLYSQALLSHYSAFHYPLSALSSSLTPTITISSLSPASSSFLSVHLP